MSKKIIKILSSLLAFLLFFLIPFFFMNNVFRKQWDNLDNVVERRKEYRDLPEDSINTIILGSSGTYAAINPAILYSEEEIYSFNFSASLNLLPIRYYQLKDLINERPGTKSRNRRS
jgi:heme/copper-type cytochrome/quinol oxidase subunit 3